jgi:hypothetical protein
MKQGRSKISDKEILDAYKKGLTLHETAAIFNITNISMWRRAKKAGVKFTNKNENIKWNTISLEEILDGKFPSYQTYKLKNRLVREGIKENKCEICNIKEWQGEKINMQLDHIDGDSHNHLLKNLRMLCPNCHSQTSTYCGKN